MATDTDLFVLAMRLGNANRRLEFDPSDANAEAAREAREAYDAALERRRQT